MTTPTGIDLVKILEDGGISKHFQVKFWIDRALSTGDFKSLEMFIKQFPVFLATANKNIRLREYQSSQNPYMPYPTRKEVNDYLNGEIQLGYVNQFDGMFSLLLDTLCKMLVVKGRVGSGKSVFLKNLILQVFALQVRTANLIVVDPQRREYRGLLPFCSGLCLVSPDRLRMNPLAPPPWLEPLEYIYLVADIMVSELRMAYYARNSIISLISYLYRQRGIFNGSHNYPMIRDLHSLVFSLSRKKMPGRVLENYSLIENRLSPLVESGYFECRTGIPWEFFRTRDLILEMDGVQDQIYCFIICLIIRCLYRANVKQGFVDSTARTIFVLEEARTLLQADREPTAWGESALNQDISRLRSPGIAIVLATQEPKSVSPTMSSLAFTKVCFPLTAGSDLEWVQKSYGLSNEQRDYIFKLPPYGQAVVRYGGFKRPFILAVPTIELAPTLSEASLAPYQGEFWAELDKHITKPERALPAEVKISRPEMPPACAALLFSLKKNPFSRLSDLSKVPGFKSPKEVKEAVTWLEDNKFVTTEEYRTGGKRNAKYPVLQPVALQYLGIEALPGKGSYEHKLYQNIIFDWAKGKGLKANIEGKATKASTKLIDVLVQDERDRHVAYEVTLSNENLIHNLLADFQAGVSEVVVVNSTKTAQRECLDIVSRHPALTQYLERVSFRLIEEFAPQA
jgi:hypothetical protein